MKRFNFEDVFMYLDPPYVLGTRTAKQYEHEMEDADHEELLKFISSSKAKIIISGYESDMYNDYLGSWNKAHFNSCAEMGAIRNEVIWFNFNVKSEPEQLKLII